MNTRLQVEHPVTELVTGLDLVEQMIRIAAGERLAFGQEDVRFEGWAVEARVYAEDPARGFLPSTGRLTYYVEPAGPGIRVDSGVVEGSEVSVFYDPLIAKACAHGRDRAEAIARLGDALDGFAIRGLSHNVAFLTAIMHHRRFKAGALVDRFHRGRVRRPLRRARAERPDARRARCGRGRSAPDRDDARGGDLRPTGQLDARASPTSGWSGSATRTWRCAPRRPTTALRSRSRAPGSRWRSTGSRGSCWPMSGWGGGRRRCRSIPVPRAIA